MSSTPIITPTKRNWTKRQLDDLEPQPKRYTVYFAQLRGLQMEIHPSGKKSIKLLRRVPAKDRRPSDPAHFKKTLGDWSSDFCNVADAIEKAEQAWNSRNATTSSVVTLRQGFNLWKQHTSATQNTQRCYESMFNAHLPAVADLPLDRWINKVDLRDLRDTIIERSGASSARLTLKVVQSLLNFLTDEDYAVPDWAFKSRMGKERFNEPMRCEPRTRHLPVDVEDKDIFQRWWRATADLPELLRERVYDGELWRDYFRFLLHTGLRKREAAEFLLWENVDFKKRSFRVLETKNKQPLDLPMTSFVEELLLSVWLRAGQPQTGAVFGLGEPKIPLAVLNDQSGITLSCHDLRRSFITAAELAGVLPTTISVLVNHKKPTGNITMGYSQTHKLASLRQPAELVADYLTALLKK